MANNSVMLVEDDSTMQAVLRTLLELEGYQVTVAGGWQTLDEIMQAIRATHPNVILLDVHLRDISGYDVVKRLRADEEIRQTRVVMSSGMDVKDQCMKAGADDFLMKPYMPDELIKKLNPAA